MLSNKSHKVSLCCAGRVLSQPWQIGRQSSAEEDMKTMPGKQRTFKLLGLYSINRKMESSSSFKVFTEFRLPTNTSIKVARFFGKSNCIISTFEGQLTPHLPLRDTVAGEALSTLWGSNMILQFGAIGIRSPFARVKVLLSSNTELRFSIQRVSTGPSRTNQMCSP